MLAIMVQREMRFPHFFLNSASSQMIQPCGYSNISMDTFFFFLSILFGYAMYKSDHHVHWSNRFLSVFLFASLLFVYHNVHF